jgi:hypothetical protein
VASEAAEFVASALAASAPDATAVVTVTMVNGDRALHPTGDAGQCIGRTLLVAPPRADLESFRAASDDARADVAETLREQYATQVEQVADAVRAAISNTPPADSGDAGAFDIWPFVANAPTDREVFVLAPFSVGGNNCLTLENPAQPLPSGSTLIGDRMQRCVGSGDVARAEANVVRLVPTAALELSGAQRDAQVAVVEALCRHATQRGCG